MEYEIKIDPIDLEKFKYFRDTYGILIQGTYIKDLEPEKPVKKLELSEVSILSEI
jgi:hypothetical protein